MFYKIWAWASLGKEGELTRVSKWLTNWSCSQSSHIFIGGKIIYPPPPTCQNGLFRLRCWRSLLAHGRVHSLLCHPWTRSSMCSRHPCCAKRWTHSRAKWRITADLLAVSQADLETGARVGKATTDVAGGPPHTALCLTSEPCITLMVCLPPCFLLSVRKGEWNTQASANLRPQLLTGTLGSWVHPALTIFVVLKLFCFQTTDLLTLLKTF